MQRKQFPCYYMKIIRASLYRPPLTVCWHLYHPTEKYNVSNNCPLLPINGTICKKVASPSLFDNSIDFPDSGTYTLLTSFDNNADCSIKNYTLKVDTGESKLILAMLLRTFLF